MKPATPAAVQLFHEGAAALAQLEAHGWRVDLAYLDKTIADTTATIKAMVDDLKQDSVWRTWHRKYGQQANLFSRAQLSAVLFHELGYEALSSTAGKTDEDGAGQGGRESADEEALERIGIPFTQKYLPIMKLDKVRGTYLKALRREVEGDRIHAFFGLSQVSTYRGQSDSPNLTNIPIRRKEIANIIRPCFIADDDDSVLVEIDYSQLEVRVAACYNKDPTMLRYIKEDYDYHKEMAVECYRLPHPKYYKTPEEKARLKEVRQQAKALFVFAQFYGDWYISCAESLWDAVRRYKLVGLDGRELYAHMADEGIEKLGALDPKLDQPGTFVQHIKEVERRFWEDRFPVYAQWRRDWFKAYEGKGYFNTHTGFLVQGIFSRNFVINCPVQGSAFHCLLWSITKMVNWLRKEKMQSRVVCQIHDSMISTVKVSELADFVAKARQVMTEDIKEHWPWIITQMNVEVEVCPQGGSWRDKKAYKE